MMSRTTKSEAKAAINSYGSLLQERAVLSEIKTEDVRGETEYRLLVAGKKPYEIVARGCAEASLVLSSMWIAYELAYNFLYE